MNTKAFTLIELLIVVLIIAILAAIAVPNFLEFQTRAKVSRVLSDHRSITTALEAYAVDNDRYIMDEQEVENLVSGAGTLPRELQRRLSYAYLTTPISYITSFYFDPFSLANDADTPDGQNIYTIRVVEGWLLFPENAGVANVVQEAKEASFTWAMKSNGPASDSFNQNIFIPVLPGFTGAEIYDPTNGTVSRGLILRTNKGIAR